MLVSPIVDVYRMRQYSVLPLTYYILADCGQCVNLVIDVETGTLLPSIASTF